MTHKTCFKVFLRNGGTLMFVPDCYKNQKMSNKAADNYAFAIQFVSECYKAQEMCDKNIDACPFVFGSVPECYKT